jgi:hypothetical protein
MYVCPDICVEMVFDITKIKIYVSGGATRIRSSTERGDIIGGSDR